MKVNVMQLRETGDTAVDTTLLNIDDETLITVKGFGTGEYRWTVTNCGVDKSYDPAAILRGPFPTFDDSNFWEGITTLGLALVWAEPITFAHVVMDLINNQ